jgi:hypothetical protein
VIPKPGTLPSVPVSATAGPTSVGSAPELFWIGTANEFSCLWPRAPKSIEASSVPFEPFLMTVLNARFRIWILDAHFEGPEGYAVLRHALDLRLEAQGTPNVARGRKRTDRKRSVQGTQRWLS